MKTLRPYQKEADDALFDWLYNKPGFPLVVAPVGAGKSLLIAQCIKRALSEFPDSRIVVVTHVKELLEQNAEELAEYYPSADYGFYCAGLGQQRLHNDITFASIQSIASKVSAFNRPPELIIIDECHLIPHKGHTQYRKFIDDVLKLNPNAKVIGFTGTPFRADTGRLDEGHNKLFDGIAHEIPITFMIEEGYWKKPVAPNVTTHLSVDGVGIRQGDYIAGQLERAVNTESNNTACVSEILTLAADRKKWLIFTAGLEHCSNVANLLSAHGISTEIITGNTKKKERQRIIEDFRAGKFQALVNVMVLTTGFNVPDIDCIVMMRPTRSPVLYVQSIGRGVRPIYAPGYDLSTTEGRHSAIATSHCPDCLVLDFADVIKSLGPIDKVNITKVYKENNGEKGEAPTKPCPKCQTLNHAAARYCFSCFHQFEMAGFELSNMPSSKAVVSMDEKPEVVEVIGMGYRLHQKNSDSLPCLKATYHTLQGSFNSYLCFDHEPGTYPRNKATEWFYRRFPDRVAPRDTEEALEIEYPAPKLITVKRDGDFWKVIREKF